MRHSLVCALLLLCGCFCFVSAQSSPHDVQRRSTKSGYSGIIGTRMVVTPTWYVSVGDTVEINCTSYSDKGNHSGSIDLQLVWTKMGPDRTKKLLVSQRASKGFSYTLGPVTHEHQGIYSCVSDGTMPDVYLLSWHYMIWVTDASPRASIEVVSHNRSQFFNKEAFTLSCELPDDNNQWRMMRFDDFHGNITECPNQKSSDRRVSCETRSQYPWSDSLYWCETPTGERSNALNISTTVLRVTMEVPSLPVLEGEDVTLRCVHLNKTTKEVTSNFRTYFYKNSELRWASDSSNLTLSAVTKADEGLYTCRHLVDGLSPESWLTVKTRPDKDQKKKSEES